MSKRRFVKKIKVGDLIYWPTTPGDGEELGELGFVARENIDHDRTLFQILWLRGGVTHEYTEYLLKTRCYHIRHYKPYKVKW